MAPLKSALRESIPCVACFSDMNFTAAQALFRKAVCWGGAVLIFLIVLTFLRGLSLKNAASRRKNTPGGEYY